MLFDPTVSGDDTLLRLSLVEGVTVRDLPVVLRALSGPRAPGDSPGGGAVRVRLARALDAVSGAGAGERARRIREACGRRGIRIVFAGGAEYPPPLAQVPDAPLVLYVRGSLAGDPKVAIVGSRSPTEAGARFARALSGGIAASGGVVVSGMARGIDRAAHEGALDAGGATIAVLGCGLDVTYPPESGKLQRRIEAAGAAVSEYPPGTLPLPYRFPARNRIISGLSRGVVVAEAPLRSGALITARLALEQGREVMAVPGNPLFAHTAGSNRLIRDGAMPATGAEEVLSALGWSPPGAPGPLAARILDLLSRERHAEDLGKALDVPLSELLPVLSGMEVAKLLERKAGDYYKRVSNKGS